MKIGLLSRVLAVIMLSAFLVPGVLSAWASFQPYEALSQIADSLAPDGKLESFTLERFETLMLPLRATGIFLLGLTIVMLVSWRKVLENISKFVAALPEAGRLVFLDAKRFFRDLSWQAQPTLDRLALVGITLLAILPRVADMNDLFRHDESYTYIAFASGSLWTAVSDYHLPNNHVLFSVIMNLTAHWIGNQPWMLRLPTVVFGVLLVPAVYLFSKKLFGREAAIISAVLVATFPEMVKHSTSARGYILLALIAVLVAETSAYVREKKNRFAWLLVAFFSALGFYTIPIMLFPFGGVFLWLLLSALMDNIGAAYTPKTDFLKHWLLAGLGAALLTIILYSPILLTDADSLLNNSFVVPLDPAGFPSVLRSRLINTWDVWSRDIAPGWLAGVGVAGLAVGSVFHRRVANHKIPMQISFLIWIATLIIVRRPNAEPRFWSYLVPFLLVWIGAGVGAGVKRAFARAGDAHRQASLLALSLLALLVMNLWMLPSIPQKWVEQTQLERAVGYLKGKVQADDLVVVGSANGPMVAYLFELNDIQAGGAGVGEPYRRAYIVVALSFNETLEAVVEKHGPTDPAIDLTTVERIGRFGNYEIYAGSPSRR